MDTNVAGKTDNFYIPFVIVGTIAVTLAFIAFYSTYDGPVWESGQSLLTEEVVEVVVEPEEQSLSMEYRMACQANSIIAGGYGACRDHRSCSLSNEEMMAMYVAGKTAVIFCKKSEMLELFIGINEEIEVLENLKLDDPDLFLEEPDDEPQEKLRIGL